MAIVRIAAGLKSSATVQNFNLNEVYKITYETNGGILATGVHILSYSRKSEAIELATCTKTGFLFMGWYETNNPALADVPTAAKTNFSPQTEARNKTFFALWTKNTVYVKAGGSGNGFSSESPVANFSDALTAIQNLKITGGYADASAGGLYTDGDVTLSEGGIITRNYAGACGGGIYNYSKTLTIESGVEISGNSEKGVTSCGGGGGIFNSSGTVIIKGGTIKTNSANHYGGAIYNERGTVYIYGDTLIGKEVSVAPDNWTNGSNKDKA